MLLLTRKVGLRKPLATTTRWKSSIGTKTSLEKIHENDFSIHQTTYAYQLPIENEPESDIQVSASPLSLLFEYTGVPTSTSNHKLNQEVFDSYPTTTYKKLKDKYSNLQEKLKETKAKNQGVIKINRPSNVKLTTKDFIDDSLYNPYYGYFNKSVEIFNLTKPFEFSKIKSSDDFMIEWMNVYSKYNKQRNQGIQLWHTPTELFQPYYGEAIANYLCQEYLRKNFKNNLIIYEIGAGNGTLMKNTLDFVAKKYPELYENMEYRIIEISNKLYNKQSLGNENHESKIKIINQDIFQWKELVNEEVFFLAFEVFDNFSHDVLKYNIRTKIPYQGYVIIDKNNDFKEFFNPKLDFWCYEYFKIKSLTNYEKKSSSRNFIEKSISPMSPIDELDEINELKNYLWPFRNKLSENSEFIPTKLLEFFYILKNYFPNHHLVSSDFNKFNESLPNSYNGPVVQTLFLQNNEEDYIRKAIPKDPNANINDKKYEYTVTRIPKDKMVNTSTYLVHQGFFDIMFPTNFELMKDMYEAVTKKKAFNTSHKSFLKDWSVDLKQTTCKNGENPMLEFYENVEFLCTK